MCFDPPRESGATSPGPIWLEVATTFPQVFEASSRVRPVDYYARLIGADASHAWVSIYCPGSGWIDLDPTNNLIPSASHITVAWGRDYNDVSPIRGVIQGGGQHELTVSVDVPPTQEN